MKVKSLLHTEVCYLETGITMHIHFVSFYMNDISKRFMMLNNTQLHNLMSSSNREKLYKEVKRKDREASDFQVKVSEMKQQWSKHYTGKLFKMAGSSKVKALGEQSNKGSRFTHWVVKNKRVFELPVRDDILVKGLDSEKQELQTPASSQTSWGTSDKFLHLSPDFLSPFSRKRWSHWSFSPKHFLPILSTFNISSTLQADIWTARSHAWQPIRARQKGNEKATSLKGKNEPQVSF